MLSKKTAGTLALGGAATLVGGLPALGAIVYDVQLDTTKAYPDNSFVQQAGNGLGQYGDNVDLGPGVPQDALSKIIIPISLYNASPTFTYTATNLTMRVYSVDANGLPDTLLGTVDAPDTTFTGSGGFRPFIYNVKKFVEFDFLPLNIILPDKFAFGFADLTPGANLDLSVWLETENSIDSYNSMGIDLDTPRRFLTKAGGPAGPWSLSPTDADPAYNFVASIIVPEPATGIVMALGGGLLLMNRRRRAHL